MKYQIASYNFEFDSNFSYTKKLCLNYQCDFSHTDLKVSITKSEIEAERGDLKEPGYSGYLESIAISRKIAEWLPLHNAFVLHSAVFDVDGTGVAFAAKSGTGKTTHMLLWQQLLGDRLTIVNGDKPIVRFFDDIPYAYGTPWNGKEKLGTNTRTPLKHICFIERSKTNFVERLDKSQAVDYIFNQVYMPKDKIAAMNTIQFIDRLLSCCQLWKIHCNMEPDAAETAYREIFGKEIE